MNLSLSKARSESGQAACLACTLRVTSSPAVTFSLSLLCRSAGYIGSRDDLEQASLVTWSLAWMAGFGRLAEMSDCDASCCHAL